MKLGKLPAIKDKRNLRLSSFVKVKDLPPVPRAWDFDYFSDHDIPLPMFSNDQWGCCVISARAHQTLRFEANEQGRVITINDEEILREYWKEQGGTSKDRPDNGLFLLNSLKAWRASGWLAAGQHYDIFAFAEISRDIPDETKVAAYLLGGLYCGLLLPESAEGELDRGEPWRAVTDAPGGWGGHCVYIPAYSSFGPTCVTWGKKQLMSWEFFQKYCDEAYAVVDNRNRFMPESPLDIEKLAEYLRKVTENGAYPRHAD